VCVLLRQASGSRAAFALPIDDHASERMNEAALHAAVQRALAVVREVAGDLLAAGQAQLDVEDDYQIKLTPTKPAACPVVIRVSDLDIWLELGPDQWSHELWQPDEDERLRQLRLCLSAVIAGRYEERVGTETRGLLWRRQMSYHVGTFHTAEGAIEFTHHLNELRDAPDEHRTYESYDKGRM
jgi:hypothetical protein